VATLTFSEPTSDGNVVYQASPAWGWWGYDMTLTVTPVDGYTITKCVFYDNANRTATDSSSPFVVETTSEDKTPRVNGNPISDTSKGITKIEVYGYATPASSYSVTITPGDNMTKTAGSGDAEQTGLTGAMTDVVYTANDGYYFPEDYAVTAVNGISVTRDSYTQITVSGTPTADAAIALTAPTAKTTPDAPTTAAAVDCTTSNNNDGKLTGVTTAMEYKKSDADSWTDGTGSDITGLVPGTYYVRVKATETTNASTNQELTIKGFISYTVTFKVVNGKWNEGKGDAATADKTVTLTGHDGDTLELTSDQIPAVGSKPNDTYKAGGWDVTPSTETEITAATTYTYTYAQKDTISQTVTFKVVNGSWNDETTTDKTVTLTGYEGDTLKLAADQIPTVGTKPNDTYKAGSWDVTPSTETEITGATTYTYTYAQKDSISQTVTFKVVNGSWNDETTTDKTVTLTGYEGDTLKLAANQIPAVGDKPNDTYKAGSWDVMPNTDTAITEATTYTYTYVAKEASVVTKAPEAKPLTYNGQAQELVTAGTATGGEMQYALGTETEATGSYTTSIPTGTEAGTYYVWYKVVGDENHNDTDAANVPVVIAKDDPDYTVPTGLTAVYGDTLQDVTLPAGWTWADAAQIVGDAGTNTFKANYVPTDVTNYNSVENVDVTVSVSKGNGAVAVAPEVTAWTSDYVSAEAVNGQEYVIVKKGETPDWSKAVTPDEGSVTFTGLTPATEYSIYTRVKETDNTLASEPEKVDVMTSLIGWETRGEPKTGETITIIPDPENAEGLTWQWYYAEENEEYNVVRNEAIEGEVSSSYTIKETDVGKYLYYVIFKGGKELGDGYVGPVRIAIKPSVTLDGWTYGEAPNTPIVTGNTGNGEESFKYVKKGSEESESETVPTLPGTYTVFAYVEESGDYAFGYAEADFTIAKGTPAVTAPKARNLVYTGASQELVEAGVAVGGEMQYALGTETVATQPYTTSIPTATDAGTYYVWYKVVGDENHSDSVPACVPVVIESKESVEGEVTFNKGEGDAETPETVVESVESSDLTEFAETQKEEGKEVKVELEITPKKEADIVQTSVDGTKQIAEGLFVGFDTEKVVTEYFDIDLTKYVDEVKQDNISDTGSPIEIALKYDKTKMLDPVVVRTHNGETKAFDKLSVRPVVKADYKDATYYVGDGVIYIYSQYFSDYAIIYSTVKTYNVDIVTETGDKISKTVAEGSKVDLPVGLSKSGYTFGGWYGDEACTKVWNANDTVTADITIYAKWTKNPAPTQVPTTVPTSAPTPVPTSAPVTTPTATPSPTVVPTVTPTPVKDSITAEEAALGSIKLNAGLKVYPNDSDVVVKWGKVDNADRYVIYAAYCKKGRKCAKIATLDGDANTYIFSELNGKAINTKKNIKVYVVAYRKVNGKYKKITNSITAHIVGSGSKKYTNVKGIKVESTKITLSLDDNTAAPSSYTLNPVAVLKDSSKKMILHTAEFRYATSKSSVVKVGKDGTIKAQGKGTCYVYVYAQNGYAKKIKVTVK
jgi:uncharacterized repeat protein (TIGR02543 family)